MLFYNITFLAFFKENSFMISSKFKEDVKSLTIDSKPKLPSLC